MARGLLIILFLIYSTTCTASDRFSGRGYLDTQYGFGDVSIVKISPAFYSSWTPRGIILGYETGSGINYWSLNFSAKYFSGVDSSESFSPIQEYLKVELHPRFWVTDFLSGFFFSPILGVYNTGDITGGLAFGGQVYLGQRVLIDAFSAIQTSTPTENRNDAVFLKLGINLGYQISR